MTATAMSSAPRAGETPRARARKALLLLVPLTLALHGALFIGLAGAKPMRVPAGAASTAMTTRSVVLEPHSIPSASAATPLTVDQPSSIIDSPSATAAPRGEAPRVASDAAARPGTDEYIAAELLSERPSPNSEVLVLYPDLEDGPRHVKVLITLFIDEHGVVQRVAEQDDGAPEPFIAAAKSAFATAAFSPGRLSGVAVKSRWRIEVSFDRDGAS